MRILHWAFPFHLGRGGQSIWIERIAIESAHRGHKVAIMAGKTAEFSKMRSLFGDLVKTLQVDIESTEGVKPDTKKAAQVADAIENFEPDIIHIHNLESRELVYLRLYQATQGKSIPAICTLHDLVSVKRLQRTLLMTGEIGSISAVVSPSKFIESQFDSLTPSQRDKFRMIYHGVPTNLSRKVDVSGTPKLLFASDLHDHKGGIILLSAWKKLHQKFPAVTLIIAGDGRAKSFLEKYAQSSGLDAQVDFRGWLNQEELRSILNQDCILVVPSLLGEAFGLIAAEASMIGASLIVSRSGALPEIVLPEKSGLVVTPGDSIELADAIERLLTNPSLRLSLGRAARERAEILFSLPESVLAYEQLYEEVTNRP
jgi:glycosyltransferase involved in cell wall biosynthesis